MKHYHLLISLLLLLIIPYEQCYSQMQDLKFLNDLQGKIVAKAGNIEIDGKEFLLRYEFTPLFRKQIKRMTESLKLEFLYSLIAEKLWAQQAQEMGYDTLSIMKYVSDKFEKMFVRDELYKREVKDKIKISDKELIQGYARYNLQLEVNYLFADSRDNIDKLYELLKQGIPFDSLLSVRPEAKEQIQPEEIIYGQMDESIEDTLYALKVGNYSKPLSTPDGWYIFRLTNKLPRKMNTGNEDVTQAVKKIMSYRKEVKIYRNYFEKFFNHKKVETNAVLFRSLARKISDELTRKRIDDKVKESDPVFLQARDELKIEHEFGADSLSMPYIQFDKNPKSLKDFLNDLVFDGFSTKETSLTAIMKLLSAKNRTNIEHELLARKGIEEGLDKLPSVRHDILMWKQNYLAQLLRNKFLDSAKVSDKEVFDFYKRYNKDELYPEEVNIVEVLNDNPKIIEKIMKEIKAGESIKKLAFAYTQRTWAKKDSGKFGYFPVGMHGEIGKIAATLKVGDIYGPLKVPGGYSIFELIGKRKSKKEQAQPFNKVKDDLRSELQYKKAKKSITNYTLHLALKYGIDINTKVLRSIPVTHLNTFGFRYLGFGGKITAAPLMMPNVDWVEPYLKKSYLNP